MESAAVVFLLDNITSLLVQYTDLGGIRETMRFIENELDVIFTKFERIQALYQIPKEVTESMNRTSEEIGKIENLILTYARITYQRKLFFIKVYVLVVAARKLNEAAVKIKTLSLEFSNLDESTWSSLDSQVDQVMPGSDASTILHKNVNQKKKKNVPFYLRQCIYYFLLFPANFDVPARRLIVLWVAEGLVRSRKHQTESVEHIAESYLDELIDLKMVTVTRNRTGRVKTCRLNDGTRDTWLGIAKEAKFLQDKTGNIRRLIDHNGTRDGASFIQIHGDASVSHSVPNYKDIISFLSFDTQEGSKPGEDIGDFLRKCISSGCFAWLKILDLERVFRPKLPTTVGKLIRLKYLGLRWTYLEHLPNFVDRLLSLQVLDVKHTYISVLPRSIWSMQYLRHLYLSETYRTRFVGRPSGITLTALQTLWGASIDEDTCVTDGLDTLQNVRKLGVSCRPRSSQNPDMSKQLIAVDKWISNLKLLESLRLKSRDNHGKASDLHLSSLKGHKNLSTVYLLGKLDPPVVCEFPVSLTDIALSGSELDVDPMPFLARLPNLVIIRLLARSVVHNKMHCSRRGFPQLKVLYIWKLENLEELEVEEGSLPSLEVLEIRSCEKLKTLPDGLQYVDTLREFRLTSMPEGFLNSDSLKGNKNLSTVYLHGKLDPSVVREFPASLTDITLSGSELDVDPMPFLEGLPNLTILRLLGQSVVRNRIHCSRRGFPLLEVLYIWKLENLEEWEVEEGSLPSLEDLEIRSCEKLKKLPNGLRHVNTLKKFSLTSMPKGFLDGVMENQSQLWDEIKYVTKVVQHSNNS